jgi:predicted RNA-binding Zn ribbon-like protein
MQSLFLGSHPAIDFLNSVFAPDGEPIETIGDGAAYVEWLVAAGLLKEAEAAKLSRRFGAKALDAAATEARKFREWARQWLADWRAAPRADYSDRVETLNRLLAREVRKRELLANKGGIELREVPSFETAQALLALPAAQIALLLTREDPALLRECAGDSCTLWFLDRTKSHRRLFCSAAACGNRAKVAAFRERQR